MRFIIVQNGKVVNVAEASAEFGALQRWIEHETAEIGDVLTNGEFVSPPQIASIPREVTMRQARQALILAGLDEAVEAAIDAIPGTAGKLARAEWNNSQVVQRSRPLVSQLGDAIGLTPKQIDDLFITAATL